MNEQRTCEELSVDNQVLQTDRKLLKTSEDAQSELKSCSPAELMRQRLNEEKLRLKQEKEEIEL